MKRQGERGAELEPSFKSTSVMAAGPFLAAVERLQPGASVEVVSKAAALLGKSGTNHEDRDAALLYASRLREWVSDELALRDIERSLEDLLDRYAGRARPSPYFGLLLADGDHMGAAIDNQPDAARHREISRALSAFAGEAKEIVNGKGGCLIYAGGDDVLAFVPLHTALEIAGSLAERFAATMQGFSASTGKHPTLSAGLVIAHHLDPLSDTLDLARQAERSAKDAGRDALAITLSKRSGVDRTIVDQRDKILKRLQELILLVRSDAISKGVAYELQESARVLGGPPDPRPDALRAEASRILGRKRESRSDKLASATAATLIRWLSQREIGVDELGRELILAGVFASALDMAEGPLVPTGVAS